MISIEEAAKRVRDAEKRFQAAKRTARFVDEWDNRSAVFSEFAPQLAEWVEKALPVIEAARLAISESNNPFGDPTTATVRLPRSIFNDMRDRLAALDTSSSSLAAEGTTEA